MVTEIAILGGLVGFLGLSVWLDREPPELALEALLRDAMRGPDGAALRAEFRRSGIEPPQRWRPQVPLLWRSAD